MRKRHLLIAALAAIFSSTVARAATFHIPRGDVDALITAIQTANSNFEDDVITVAGTYVVPEERASQENRFIAQDKIHIRSRHHKARITPADGSALPLFTVSSTLVIEGLILDWGLAPAFLNNHEGRVVILRCVVTGVTDAGILNYGRMTISHSAIVRNESRYESAIVNEGFMSLLNTMVARNISGGAGGGIKNIGTLVLNQSRIIRNQSASYGGGIYNANEGAGPPTLVINGSRIAGNRAAYSGGGISQAGDGSVTVLTNSVVTGNEPDQIDAPDGELIVTRGRTRH